MRTTVTLDPDVAQELRRKLKSTGQSQKEIVNAALRKGLPGVAAAKKNRFKVVPHSMGLRPEYEGISMNKLYDQLLEEDFLRQQERDLARR
jgi:hypothetical protein